MSASNLVLILGYDNQSSLTDDLFEMGFTPFVRDNVEKALSNLRHEHFIFVVYERSDLEVDPLEFVLNVRDINDHIPVIILGETSNQREDKVLLEQDDVYVITDYYKEFRNLLYNILPEN